jgi:hypothetical protein
VEGKLNMYIFYITRVEPSSGLSGNVMQMISLASKNSGASLT